MSAWKRVIQLTFDTGNSENTRTTFHVFVLAGGPDTEARHIRLSGSEMHIVHGLES
jgi:hypothetical protein